MFFNNDDNNDLLEVAKKWGKYCALMGNFDHLRSRNKSIPNDASHDNNIEGLILKMKKVHHVFPNDKGGEAKHAAIADVKECFLAWKRF